MKRITSQAALLLGASLIFSSLTSFADAFTPLSLAGAANASRMDETAADGKGGWLDLGANDLRVLPAGRKTYAGVPYMRARYFGLDLVQRLGLMPKLMDSLFGAGGIWAC